ncbi:MAG: hypothetical protein RQ763_05140 [Sulfurimonas sp.]|uniref:hypothetical protein n=1 Tax=Sulfurimonas sp. TaxID=2022749 RepID=UPI0028CED402|nr:hypothetical protein [Sulfurimonas sp.]MDT8338564.1 hypothetical protein [Sulfurimonas sp.]
MAEIETDKEAIASMTKEDIYYMWVARCEENKKLRDEIRNLKERLQSEIVEGAKFQRWYYDERNKIEPAEDKSLLDSKNINLAKAMKIIK